MLFSSSSAFSTVFLLTLLVSSCSVQVKAREFDKESEPAPGLELYARDDVDVDDCRGAIGVKGEKSPPKYANADFNSRAGAGVTSKSEFSAQTRNGWCCGTFIAEDCAAAVRSCKNFMSGQGCPTGTLEPGGQKGFYKCCCDEDTCLYPHNFQNGK